MVFDRSLWWYEEKHDSNNSWEYIPGMSEIRLNDINEQLKVQGYKCPEIRTELDYRHKSKINNIVLDEAEITTNKISNEKDTDKVIDDMLLAYADILSDTPNLETDFNPICLELDSRFEFNKL